MAFNPEKSPFSQSDGNEALESNEQKPSEVYIYAQDVTLTNEKGKPELNTWFGWEGIVWTDAMGKIERKLLASHQESVELLAQNLAGVMDRQAEIDKTQQRVSLSALKLFPDDFRKEAQEDELKKAKNVIDAKLRALTKTEADRFMQEYKKSRKILPPEK